MAKMDGYGVIILDLVLPDGDGVEICRELREQDVVTPILMLTVRGSTHEKISGLDAGADDYLAKPFEIDELLARVRAVSRRIREKEITRVSYVDLTLDIITRKAFRAGREIPLTAREFRLLEFLVRNAEKVISKDTITDQIWADGSAQASNVIEVYISRLRSKIDKGFEKPLLHTVVGSGYVISEKQLDEMKA